MKQLFLIAMTCLVLVSCGPVPSILNLDEENKYQVMSEGYARWGINRMAVGFSDSDRLNLMPGPVTVISKGEVSHGVFREKYVTFDMVVRDGKGRFWTFRDTAWGSLKPGDEVKK